jgi:cytochrome d ubiquinol oxidase subunit II
VVAVAGLPIVHADAHPLYSGLVEGPGLAGLTLSILAGLATLALVATRRFAAARISASVAVSATIAGWALAQQPVVLAHLTLAQAAAPKETLVVLLAAIAMGGAILFPSLALLFGLMLRGRFDDSAASAPAPAHRTDRTGGRGTASSLYARVSLAGLAGGLGLLTAAQAPWAHAVGVVCLLAHVVFGFLSVGPAQLAQAGD